MGRKIPGRKHRGVKDPEKQRVERWSKIKDKINTAPLNPDDQQIPSTLSKIIELKSKVKQGLFTKKKNRKKNNEKEYENKSKRFKGKPEKHIPKFERLPGESERDFKHRMNRICTEVIKEAAYEDKYNINIIRNEEGEVEEVEKRPKDELELLAKKIRKEAKLSKNKKGKKKKKSSDGEQPRLTKSQKWALKKSQKRKQKDSKKEQEFTFLPQKEHVKFGEVAHGPPTLNAPKKGEKLPGASRPGQKQLLLKSMFVNGPLSNNSKNVKKDQWHRNTGISITSKTIDKKGKRRDLPHALRRQLDKQQKEIIEAYKMLKSKKH